MRYFFYFLKVNFWKRYFLLFFLFFLFNSIPKQTNFINTLPKGFFFLEFEAFKGNILSNWNSYLFFVTNRFNFVSTFLGGGVLFIYIVHLFLFIHVVVIYMIS